MFIWTWLNVFKSALLDEVYPERRLDQSTILVRDLTLFISKPAVSCSEVSVEAFATELPKYNKLPEKRQEADQLQKTISDEVDLIDRYFTGTKYLKYRSWTWVAKCVTKKVKYNKMFINVNEIAKFFVAKEERVKSF